MVSNLFFLATALSSIFMILALALNLLNEFRPKESPYVHFLVIIMLSLASPVSFTISPFFIEDFPLSLAIYAFLTGALGYLCFYGNTRIAGEKLFLKSRGIGIIILTIVYLILINGFENQIKLHFLN